MIQCYYYYENNKDWKYVEDLCIGTGTGTGQELDRDWTGTGLRIE